MDEKVRGTALIKCRGNVWRDCLYSISWKTWEMRQSACTVPTLLLIGGMKLEEQNVSGWFCRLG